MSSPISASDDDNDNSDFIDVKFREYESTFGEYYKNFGDYVDISKCRKHSYEIRVLQKQDGLLSY